MKKFNSIIIATIVATLVISMFAFQPTATEASNNVSPTATPSPRKIRKVPAPTPSPITKVKAKKSAIREVEFNKTTQRTRRKKANGLVYNEGLKEIRAKKPRKRSTQRRTYEPIK